MPIVRRSVRHRRRPMSWRTRAADVRAPSTGSNDSRDQLRLGPSGTLMGRHGSEAAPTRYL
jgi:hypothetical protein